jgi:hypothetical protein
MASTTVSPSQAAAAGCQAYLIQVSYVQTKQGHPGSDNGPTEYTTTYKCSARAADGWKFDHMEVTFLTHCTMWNTKYYGSGSSPSPDSTKTVTLGAGETTSVVTYSLETCAISLDSDGYHGDHHCYVTSPTVVTAYFTSTSDTKLTATVNVSATAGGSATGGGTRTGYDGDVASWALVAMCSNDSKYEFVGWTYANDSTILCESLTYPFEHTFRAGVKSTTYNIVANFRSRTSVTLVTKPSVSGVYWFTSPRSSTIIRPVEGQTSATFLAQATYSPPDAKTEKTYEFVRWTTSDSGVSIVSPTSKQTTVSVNYGEDGSSRTVTLIAELKSIKKYTVTINVAVDGSGGGIVSGGGTKSCEAGEKYCADVWAMPFIGYEFTGWTASQGSAPKDAEGSVCLTASTNEDRNTVTLTAHFKKSETGTETIQPETVQPAPETVEPGTETTGTETAERGWIRVDVSAEPDTMGGASGGSTTSGDVGDKRTFTLEAWSYDKSKYKFVGWYLGSTKVSDSEEYFPVHVIPEGTTEDSPAVFSYVAKFDYADRAIHVVTWPDPTTSGWTTTPEDKTLVRSGTESAATINVVATQSSTFGSDKKKYRFDHWSGSGCTFTNASSPFTSVSIPYPAEGESSPKEVTLTAVCIEEEKKVVTFETKVDGNGTASGDTTVTVYKGEQACATLTATPKAGSKFKHWTHNGSVVSTNRVAEVCVKATDATASRMQTYVAVFEKRKIKIHTGVITGGFGDGGWTTLPGDQTVEQQGMELSYTFDLIAANSSEDADQEKKYDFDHWEIGVGEGVFEDASSARTNFTVNFPTDDGEGDYEVSVAAVLKEREKVTVRIEVGAEAGGQAYCAYEPAEYYVGDVITTTIFAIPDDGHAFCWWERNGNVTDLADVTEVSVVADAKSPVTVFNAVFTGGETETTGTGTETTKPETTGPESKESASVRVTVASFDLNKGRVSGGGYSYGHVGDSYSIEVKAWALAGTNYVFDGWYENGVKVSTSATYNVTGTLKSGTSSSPEVRGLTADFREITETGDERAIRIITKPEIENAGWSTSPQNVTYVRSGTEMAATVNISANRDAVFGADGKKYVFAGWSGTGGTIIDASKEFTSVSVPYPETAGTVTEVVYTAKLVEADKVTMHFATSADGKGTTHGDADITAYVGEKVCADLSASPANGYWFRRWKYKGNEVSTERQFTACLVASAELARYQQVYTAVFEKKKVVVTTAVDRAGTGWVTLPEREEHIYDGKSNQVVVSLNIVKRAASDDGQEYEFDHWAIVVGDGTLNVPEVRDADLTTTYPSDSDESGVKYVHVVAVMKKEGTGTETTKPGTETTKPGTETTKPGTETTKYETTPVDDEDGVVIFFARAEVDRAGKAHGTVDPTKKVVRAKQGTTAEFVSTATPNKGYTFIGWYEGSVLVTQNPTLYVYKTVTEADQTYTYVAKFSRKSGNILYDPGSCQILYGTKCTILYEDGGGETGSY